MSDPTQEKKRQREAVLSRLRAVPVSLREERSSRLRHKLRRFLDLPDAPHNLVVGLYAPLPHEVNLLPLLREYPSHRYAFPRCLPGRKLLFHLVSRPEEELVPGAWGIPAPRPSLPDVPPEHIDILIVPGVAFTPGGKRLGYGGGYYDRFLPLCTRAIFIALAFPEQILPELPTESHDWPIPHLLLP